MAETPKRPSLKSTAGNKPMRSRGFLSHGGQSLEDGASRSRKSQGMLAHGTVNESAPRELDRAKPRRPFSMEDK